MQNETTYEQTWHAQAVALHAHDSFAHWRAAGIDDGDVLDGHHGEPAAILLYRSGVGTALRIRSMEPPAKAEHCQKTNVATSPSDLDNLTRASQKMSALHANNVAI